MPAKAGKVFMLSGVFQRAASRGRLFRTLKLPALGAVWRYKRYDLPYDRQRPRRPSNRPIKGDGHRTKTTVKTYLNQLWVYGKVTSTMSAVLTKPGPFSLHYHLFDKDATTHRTVLKKQTIFGAGRRNENQVILSKPGPSALQYHFLETAASHPPTVMGDKKRFTDARRNPPPLNGEAQIAEKSGRTGFERKQGKLPNQGRAFKRLTGDGPVFRKIDFRNRPSASNISFDLIGSGRYGMVYRKMKRAARRLSPAGNDNGGGTKEIPTVASGRRSDLQRIQAQKIIDAVSGSRAAAEQENKTQFDELAQHLKQTAKRSDKSLLRLNQSLQDVKRMLADQKQTVAAPIVKAPSYYGRLK